LAKRIIEPVDIVRAVLDDLRGEQAGRRVKIEIGDLPPFEGDPVLMKQIFVNLLGNALKFTRGREKSVIEVGRRE